MKDKIISIVGAIVIIAVAISVFQGKNPVKEIVEENKLSQEEFIELGHKTCIDKYEKEIKQKFELTNTFMEERSNKNLSELSSNYYNEKGEKLSRYSWTAESEDERYEGRKDFTYMVCDFDNKTSEVYVIGTYTKEWKLKEIFDKNGEKTELDNEEVK